MPCPPMPSTGSSTARGPTGSPVAHRTETGFVIYEGRAVVHARLDAVAVHARQVQQHREPATVRPSAFPAGSTRRRWAICCGLHELAQRRSRHEGGCGRSMGSGAWSRPSVESTDHPGQAVLHLTAKLVVGK